MIRPWRHRSSDPVTAQLAPQVNLLEVLLVLLAVSSGVSALAAGLGATSVGVVLSPAWALAWGAGLLSGAALVLIGMAWWGRRQLRGLHFQQIGYLLFGAFSLARGVALLGVTNPRENPYWVLAFAVLALGQLVLVELRIRRWLPSGVTRRG